MRLVLIAAALAACSGTDPVCEATVDAAVACIETFCGAPSARTRWTSKLCECVRQGKDVDLGCACADDLRESFRGALCEDQTASGAFDCASVTPDFAELATSPSCAGSGGGCKADAECPEGVCTDGRCRSSCEQDYDCGLGDGHICEDGRCRAGCRQGLDCRALRTEEQGSICVDQRCQPGCESSVDCPIGKDLECYEGMCRKRACQYPFDCTDGSCVDGFCS